MSDRSDGDGSSGTDQSRRALLRMVGISTAMTALAGCQTESKEAVTERGTSTGTGISTSDTDESDSTSAESTDESGMREPSPDYSVKPTVEWSREFDGEFSTYLDLDNKRLYVDYRPSRADSEQKNWISGYNLETGDKEWEIREQELLDTNSALITTKKGTLSASRYRPSSGRHLWTTQLDLPGEPEGLHPTLKAEQVGDVVVVSSGQDGLKQNAFVGLDVETGEVQWRHEVSLPGPQNGVTMPFRHPEDPMIMFSTEKGLVLLRFDLGTGTIGKRVEYPNLKPEKEYHSAWLERRKGLMYIKSFYSGEDTQGEGIRVVRPVEETPILTVTGQTVRSSFSEDDVLFVIRSGELQAVEIQNGNTRWRKKIPSSGRYRIFQAQKRLYGFHVHSSDDGGVTGKIDAYNPETGAISWSQPAFSNRYQDRESDRLPNLLFTYRDDTLFAERERNELIGLDGETGEPHGWRVTLPEGFEYYGFVLRNNHLLATAETGGEENSKYISLYSWPMQSLDSQPE